MLLHQRVVVTCLSNMRGETGQSVGHLTERIIVQWTDMVLQLETAVSIKNVHLHDSVLTSSISVVTTRKPGSLYVNIGHFTLSELHFLSNYLILLIMHA